MTVATLPLLEAQARVETPLGPLLLAASRSGLAGVWFDAQSHHPGELDAPSEPRHRHLVTAARALAAYFAGRTQGLERVPVDFAGTPFQREVWQALRQIPAGQAWSYGELAQQVGRPRAVRAVAAAVGRNPLSIVVPCHRVLGRDGSLTGYASGLQRKQALLRLEGVLR